MKGGGAPVGAIVSWGLAMQRMTPSLCASGEAARPSGRARLAALHRGVRRGHPSAQLRAAFPGITGCKREDPPRRQCSELLADRHVPDERCPEAARSGLCRSARGRRARCRNQEHPHDGVPSQRAALLGKCGGSRQVSSRTEMLRPSKSLEDNCFTPLTKSRVVMLVCGRPNLAQFHRKDSQRKIRTSPASG
jgi:hypothetical protein